MQVASFILVNDRLLHHFEDQVEAAMKRVATPAAVFLNLVQMRLQELGAEHPISIPVSSLFPLDQAAERQHEQLLSAFEDPSHPSRLGRMAQHANVPLYYISPGRVRQFLQVLEKLRLATQLRPDDVVALLGKRISHSELPAVARLIDQFRHDLYQVYLDAAMQGKGVLVLVVSQAEIMASDDSFPRAA